MAIIIEPQILDIETVNPVNIDIAPVSEANINISTASAGSASIAAAATSNNYEALTQKPKINGVTLKGNLSSEDLHITEDLTYFHNQTIASDTWVITHNLNKFPSVTVIDSSGNEVIGDVTYDNVNQVTLKFAGEFKGSATLN